MRIHTPDAENKIREIISLSDAQPAPLNLKSKSRACACVMLGFLLIIAGRVGEVSLSDYRVRRAAE